MPERPRPGVHCQRHAWTGTEPKSPLGQEAPQSDHLSLGGEKEEGRGEGRHCTCVGRESCFCCGNLYLCKYRTYIYLPNMGCELFVLILSLVFCFRWPIPSGEVTAHVDMIEFTPIEGKSSAGKGVRMVLV
jgi:hypothetical protein